MKYARALAFAAAAAITVVTATGCAVARNQETLGAYVDDAGITTAVKAKMAEDKTVAATSISVETLNGTVQLRVLQNRKPKRTRLKPLHAAPRTSRKYATASLCAPER